MKRKRYSVFDRELLLKKRFKKLNTARTYAKKLKGSKIWRTEPSKKTLSSYRITRRIKKL